MSVTEATDFSDSYFRNMAAIEDLHPWNRAMRRLMMTLLRSGVPAGPVRILDVGCGTGLFLTEWKRTVPTALAAGVDLFPAALVRAQRRSRGCWVAGSAAALPFSNSSFDVIHSADVLQHLSLAEAGQAFDLFRDLLRTGGRLGLRVRGEHAFEKVARIDYSHAFSTRSLRRALESRGFRIRFLSHTNALPSLWAEAGRKVRRVRQSGGHAAGMAVHNITLRPNGDLRSRLLGAYLTVETAWLLASRRGLPVGHSIVCVAEKAA